MHIGIIALGSRGDVQPCIALGRGLVASGHTVRIITHAMFESFVREHGLAFGLVQRDPMQALQSDTGQAAVHNDSPIRSLQNFLSLVQQSLPSIFTDILAASQDIEALISSPLGFYVAPHIAERLRIPLINAYFFPIHPTRAFPHYLFASGRELSPLLNRLTYIPDQLLGWMPFLRTINRCRRTILDLPPVSPRSLSTQNDRYPMLYGFSPSVIPRPPDWGTHVQVTGYWFLDHAPDWQPPADLAAFLAAGPKPIYVGFGSMNSRQAEQTTAIVLEALRQTRQRAILSTGWGGLNAAVASDQVCAVESVPHDWLFPQMAAVIHHGGAGTTAAGLRAGVPTIIVPFYLDQPFWGHRVAKLGVGTEPFPRKSLTVEKLSRAIELCITDTAMQSKAAALGANIRAEDGIHTAVDCINTILSTANR